MGDLKSSKQAVGATLLTEVTDFAPPTIAAQAARLQSRQRFFNLVVTNVPGPQFPLYLLGRELQDVFPMVPLAKNQGVCFALMSYNGRVNFGLTADYDAMPDLDQLAGDLEASIAELAAAAPSAGGRQGAKARPPQAPVRGPSRAPGLALRQAARAGSRLGLRPHAPSRPTLRRCSRAMRIGAAFTRWEHRYGWVLLLILCSLVFQLAAPDQDWARVVTIALQGGALVLALYASQARPLIARLTILVVTLAVLGSAAALVGFGEFGTTAGWIVAALLVALAPLVIARGVDPGRSHGRLRDASHTMFGVLCIYLLLGMLFAFAYGLVGDVQSEPFFASGIDPDISDYLYFSFATMTTVGYGDLVAGTDLGRSVAITEALDRPDLPGHGRGRDRRQPQPPPGLSGAPGARGHTLPDGRRRSQAADRARAGEPHGGRHRGQREADLRPGSTGRARRARSWWCSPSRRSPATRRRTCG